MLNLIRITFLVVPVLCSMSSSGQVVFQDVALNSGIDHKCSIASAPFVGPMAGGAGWIDYDDDGWEDLVLVGGLSNGKLYRNNGDGSFQDVSVETGIAGFVDGVSTNGVSVGDLDRNGFEDLIITTEALSNNLVLMNDGNGNFTEESMSRGIVDVSFSAGIAIGDYNQDGWLDLYFANWRQDAINFPENGYPDRLYQNNGDGTFNDVTAAQSMWSDVGAGLAPSFSDYDLDGDVDLLLANDFGQFEWSDENRLFINDDGVFSDVSQIMGFNQGINAMGIAAGDYDEDGDFDYYVTNIAENLLLRNDIDSFSDQASQAEVLSQFSLIDTAGMLYANSWSWGTTFLDYDNNTELDLFVSNGHWSPFGTTGRSDENRLYRKVSGLATFEDVSVQTGMADAGVHRGCAAADYDRDGDMDLVVVQYDSVGGSQRTMLMRNNGGNTSNWLEVELSGIVSNLDGIGSTVYIYVDGRVLMRQVDSGGSSYLSHHSKILHFGLGEYGMIDSVLVVWPNGNNQTVESIVTNQRLEIVEEAIIVGVDYQQEKLVSCYPNPANTTIHIHRMGKYEVEINYSFITSLGQSVTRGVLLPNQNSIDVTHLADGVYVLGLEIENGLVRSMVSICH
jgi:hypothetical protein